MEPGTPLRIAALDLNGQWRGKRLEGAAACKGAIRMPLSALSVDIFGEDIVGSPLVFASGDADGVVRATGRGPVPMPWLAQPQALEPGMMVREDGTPFAACPRQALVRVLERFAARGWRVTAGLEMEFMLVDDSGAAPVPPRNPLSGRRLRSQEILSARLLDAFDPFLSDLAAGATAMGIDVETITSEGGAGQFEVTLSAVEALRAADDAALFKALARGVARRHGVAATFMAKPYAEDAGNGMHVHASICDDEGRNVFDDGSAEGSGLLRQAIAGCLACLGDATLIFAPHGNSYARLVPGMHAPTTAQWGYENRTAALRVPGGSAEARRLEHRVPGGDTNPYLVMAAVLGGALVGIEDALVPPSPVTGNAYETEAPGLAESWEEAVERSAASQLMRRIFASELVETLVQTKRQEIARLADIAEAERWQVWLETV